MTEEVKSLIELKPMPKIDKLLDSSSFENVSTKLQEINNLLKVSSDNLKIIMDANYLMYESTDKFTDLVQKLNDKPSSLLVNGKEFNSILKQHFKGGQEERVYFVKRDTMPTEGIDVSVEKDKSIMLYGETKINDVTMPEPKSVAVGHNVIVSKHKIMFNKDCSGMFEEFNIGYLNPYFYFENVDTTQVKDMSYMFYRMATLTDFLNFKDINTKNVTNMSGMFRECTKLQSIDFSNIDLSNVTDISSMFQDCSSLQSINGLDKLELKKVTNYAAAFLSCNKLNGEITISNHSIINYINMFYDCSIEPNTKFTVNYIDEETKKIAEQMVATKSPESNVILGKLVTQ